MLGRIHFNKLGICQPASSLPAYPPPPVAMTLLLEPLPQAAAHGGAQVLKAPHPRYMCPAQHGTLKLAQ